jgi:signal peptide peptidase SppA
LDVDSPGGGVYGVAEVSEFIRANRMAATGGKPIITQINSLAASGGYWIGSSSDEIIITPGGEAGSIGVYMLHEDISKWLEKEGIKETFIYAGDYKVEGNPFEPLGDEAAAHYKSRVNDYMGMFIDSVAKGRNVASKKVIDDFGKGRVFGASQALAAGMVDRVGTLDETLARYGIQRRAGKSAALREREMIAAESL